MLTVLARSCTSLWFSQLASLPRRGAAPCLVPSTPTSISSCSCRKLSSSTSAAAAGKNEYLVIVPDHPDSLQKRLAVREQHLENVRPLVESGDVVLGGAILSRHPKKGEQPDMTGSAMLVKAESEEALREWIAGDVYSKCGAWNVAEAKIYPYRSAIRTAL